MRRTLFEELGLKSKSCRVWDSHVAVGLSCFAFAPSAAAFWAVFLCLVRVEIQVRHSGCQRTRFGSLWQFCTGAWHFDPDDPIPTAWLHVYLGGHNILLGRLFVY